MGKSTGKSTGNPQATTGVLGHCNDCGRSVYFVPVRLAGGTLCTLPVDMVPWQGSRTHLRLGIGAGGAWFTDPHAGPWQEHACRRSQGRW